MSRPSKIFNAVPDGGAQAEDNTKPITPLEPLPADHGIARAGNSTTSACARKERSGLAFAAGFAALAYLFHLPLISLIFDFIQTGSGIVAAVLTLVLGLTAPLALWIGVIAWADLKRRAKKSGRLPATLGLIVGSQGTLNLILGIYEVAKFLSGRG